MTTSKTKTYNRDAAILYAQKWANSFNPQYPNFEKIGVENSIRYNKLRKKKET